MPGIKFNRSETERENNPVILKLPAMPSSKVFTQCFRMGKALSFASCPCGLAIMGGVGKYYRRSIPLSARNVRRNQLSRLWLQHDVKHTVEVVDPTHPITNGIPVSFEFTDELYLAPFLKKMCTQYSDHVMTSLVSISTQQILRYVVKASVIKTGNIHPLVMQWGG